MLRLSMYPILTLILLLLRIVRLITNFKKPLQAKKKTKWRTLIFGLQIKASQCSQNIEGQAKFENKTL